MPFSVLQDYVSPAVVLTVAERITTSTIPLQWSAVEDGSGVQYYDVEYKVNDGDWVRWFTATTQTQATFAGQLGVAYTFRMRATDNVNNASDWVQATAKTVVVKKYYSIAGQRIAMRANGVLYYLHTDHLGSTSLTTDETGAVVAEQRYLPYGEVRWVTGTLPTDFGFTGQRAENGLGIYDYKARFFSPRLGRFLSADTLVPGVGSVSLNRYMYVAGNPIRMIDPSGHVDVEDWRWGGMPPIPPQPEPCRLPTAPVSSSEVTGTPVPGGTTKKSPQSTPRPQSPEEHLQFSSMPDNLDYPIVYHLDNGVDVFIMQPGTSPSVSGPDWLRKRLATALDLAGLAVDGVEMILIFTPWPGDEDIAAGNDFFLTAWASFCSGESYALRRLNPDLPGMLFVVNQDVLFTGAEWGIGKFAKDIGRAVDGPRGYVAGLGVDFATTGSSMAYDYARLFRDYPNYISAGLTITGRPVVFLFPPKNGE